MKRLPLIELASSFISATELEDCYIIGAQHILPTTYTMILALCEKGLKPENVALLGKCYSTDAATYHAMREAGFDVCENTVHFDSHTSFDKAFQSHIHAFFAQRKDRLNDKKYKKVIILDDGGECIEIAPQYLDSFDHVVGMEQTSSGYNFLRDKQHFFPIVNVARSEAKLTCESSKIIEEGITQLRKELPTLAKQYSIKITNALVIGNGPIGERMIEALKSDGYQVKCFDIDAAKSDFSVDEFAAIIGTFDLIVGCTGTTSLKKEYHHLLKNGCILASMSSSDREFDAIHLRYKAAQTNNCSEHIQVDGVILLHCGFPMTFFIEQRDNPQFFQFTRSLIISAIAQAIKLSSKVIKGFVELKREWQQILMRTFKKFLNMFQTNTVSESAVSSKKIIDFTAYKKQIERKLHNIYCTPLIMNAPISSLRPSLATFHPAQSAFAM